MTPAAAENARLLFVIDNDYGELTMAMYFLYGQPMADRTTVLLPPRLFATNGTGLGVRTLEYRNYAELVQHITAEDPHLVILFSGYLLPVHELLTLELLHMLVRWIESRGCRVATYDPFWGLMPTAHLAFSPGAWKGWPFEAVRFLTFLAALPLRPGQNLRFDPNPVPAFSKAGRILRSLVHVNPAPLDAQAVPVTSFFNPHLIGVPAPAAASPYWLFVLSQLDHRVQKAKAGHGVGFARNTAASLTQALDTGRRCVVLAPEEAVAEITSVMPRAAEVEWLTFCPFHQFMSVIVGAEYAFYWNVMTSSSLVRWVNALPVFSFDRGHVARDMAPVYAAMVKWFFQGWEPSCLDQAETLTVERLQRLATEQARASIRIREHLRQAPLPDDMVNDLLGVTPRAAIPANP